MNRLGVSIVICCHNSSSRLPKTLAYLKDQKTPSDLLWEVIIVDNASADGTGEKAQSIWDQKSDIPFKVVEEPKPGLMNARFKGFESSHYEFVSFIDDDNWLADDWVKTVFKKMIQYPNAGAIGGQSIAVFETKPPNWFDKYKGWYAVGKPLDLDGKPIERECKLPEGKLLWGAGLTIRKSAWQGLLDRGVKPVLSGRKGKKLSSGEDLELCIMLLLSGWDLYFSPELIFSHFITENRLSWKYLCKLNQANGQCRLYLDHYENFFPFKYKENTFEENWKDGIYKDIKYVFYRPKRLIQSLLYMRESDSKILLMYKVIGRLTERLRLLKKIQNIQSEIEQQAKSLLDLSNN